MAKKKPGETKMSEKRVKQNMVSPLRSHEFIRNFWCSQSKVLR